MTAPFLDVTRAPVRGAGQTGVNFRPQSTNPTGGGAQGPWDSSNAGPVLVTFTGPLFSGAAQALIAAMVEEMQYAVGAQGLADVHLILDRSIKHPTPYYETQVMIQRMAADVVVHDRGIVYGPWLEGTSSRNRSTRFKGYAAFRRAADELRRKADGILTNVAHHYVAKLNGS